VVYLVHGWAGTGGQLSSFVPPLVDAGFRVVSFDAPGHGRSDAGTHGPRSSDGVEFGRALDAVAAVHGPASGVIAHSLGALATMLTLRHGWLSTRRLAFLAPMLELEHYLDQFCAAVGVGQRTRQRLDDVLQQRTGVSVADLDVAGMVADADGAELLVVHDRQDRRTAYHRSVQLVGCWPGATLVSTERLGHRRLLHDADVVATVCRFLAPEAPPSASSADADQRDRLRATAIRHAA
jgi:pimeloyl-ACP methyl ester carboxylesterase